MEGDEAGAAAAAAARIRVVRCPKCDKFLPELPAYSVYVCGGCGATLQGAHLSTFSFPPFTWLPPPFTPSRRGLRLSRAKARRKCRISRLFFLLFARRLLLIGLNITLSFLPLELINY